MDSNNPFYMESVEFYHITESLDWFGTEMSSMNPTKCWILLITESEIEGIHLHHRYVQS